RPVPRGDRADDPDRSVMQLGVVRPVVDDHLPREQRARGRAQRAHAALDLVAGADAADGLALLTHDRVGEFFRVLFDVVGRLAEVADAVLVGERRPGRLGLRRLADRLADVFQRAVGVTADALPGRRVVDLGRAVRRADLGEQGLTSLHACRLPESPELRSYSVTTSGGTGASRLGIFAGAPGFWRRRTVRRSAGRVEPQADGEGESGE